MVDRTCSVEGCENPAACRGFCNSHYARKRRTGELGLLGPKPQPDPFLRFWTYVNVRGPGECWPWRSTITHEGYGVFALTGGQAKAHRMVYELVFGPIPDGMTIDHVCHTNDPTCLLKHECPHRRCCNPTHLEPVPPEENVRRGHRALVTHCPQGHPYSGDNLYLPPSGGRTCRACHRETERRRRMHPTRGDGLS